MAGAAGAHLGGVGVKHAGIVGFPVFGEKLHDLRVHLIAVVLAGLHRHADAAVGLKGPLEGLVGLKAHDGFFFLI